MPMLELTDQQVVELVRQLPPDQKRATYGDVLVTVMQNSRFDRAAFREVIEDAGADDDELWQLVLHATGFEADELPDRLKSIVEDEDLRRYIL